MKQWKLSSAKSFKSSWKSLSKRVKKKFILGLINLPSFFGKEKKKAVKFLRPYFSFQFKVMKKVGKKLKPCGAFLIKQKRKVARGLRPFNSLIGKWNKKLHKRMKPYLTVITTFLHKRTPKIYNGLVKTKEKLQQNWSDLVLYIRALRSHKIHRTPTFLQMEATECGSICFSIILAYYRHELTAEEARIACGVSRDGSKASHIVRAARQYNMTAKGYSVHNIDDLENCTLPAVIHWNFDHFVVFEGREGNYFYINDPATGRRRVTYDEFNRNFTGIILVLSPAKGFTTKSQPNALAKFLVASLENGFSGIVAACLLSILQVLPSLVLAFSSKVFIDYILVKNLAYWLIPMTIILVGCVALQSFIMALHQRLLVRLSIHFKLSLESLVVHKLFYLPLRFFDQRFSGDILSRLSSAEELSNLLSLEIMGALSNIFGIMVFTIVLSLLSPAMFLIMLIFIALRILVFYFSRNSIRETNIEYQQQFGKVSGVAMNGLEMIDTLKANNLERVFFKNWAANHDALLNNHQKVAFVDQRTSIWMMGFATLMTVGLLFRGTYLIMGEEITIGTLMAFIILANYLDGPVMTLLDFSSKIEKIKASINRFNDILGHETWEEMTTATRKVSTPQIDLPALKKEIVLKDVTFGYAPLDAPIFNKLSLVIPRGKTVAFVGVSGSGKSTISKIICGLYPITSGEILWDGNPIQEVNVEHRNKRISLVDQDIYLFDGTIRDNLTSWNKNVEDDVLVESLRLVGLYDELLPRGLLYCPVGENGATLSGGQRQRLEIARTILRKTDVLILDEATSSLDIPNESHIFESLSKLDITTVIIAHRLSTIQNSDMVYVIDNGTLSQSGTPKQLAKKRGIFKDLMELETE
ncbi:MAG: ATP-binding cassette domain-containing protein [Alphaproteobacteria bacterium]|jgi:ATP-binding cassette subfamily C protein|nr:ATP-binding cassette domain-containing protein [Alphaproteobacteria bacterium]